MLFAVILLYIFESICLLKQCRIFLSLPNALILISKILIKKLIKRHVIKYFNKYSLKILLIYKRSMFKEIPLSPKILTFPFLCSPKDLLITTSTKMLYSTKIYHAAPALKQINFSSTSFP